MARKRIREAEETGADSLVSCCPFCFQGLNIGISALESPLIMRDISALVAESLLGYDVFQQPVPPETEEAEDETASLAVQEKPVAVALPDQTTSVSDERAAKKAERERKRAARRTDTSTGVPEEITPAPIEEKPAAVISRQPGEEKIPEDAARDAKKADREKRRAARRSDPKTISD
jgi:heterodisulfide reductase subunit D